MGKFQSKTILATLCAALSIVSCSKNNVNDVSTNTNAKLDTIASTNDKLPSNMLRVDVGGEVYHYLQKYEDKLKTKYIDQWGVLVDVDPPYEINLNGCAQMFADFDRGEVNIRDHQECNLRTFPHQKEREN